VQHTIDGKPYGHRAYTRRSKTGKLVSVQAKGVPRLDEKMLYMRMLEHGGFTYRPSSGTFPDHGFAVSIDPQYELAIKGAVKPSDLTDYLTRLRKVFAVNEAACFGVWYDQPADKWYLDVSHVVDDEKAAASLAKQYGQEGYFDLGAKQVKIVKEQEARRLAKALFDLFNAEALARLMNAVRDKKRSVKKSMDHVVEEKPQPKVYKGAGVFIHVPDSVSRRFEDLKVPGARPPYHLTLVYVARNADDLDDHTRAELERECRIVAMKQDPMLCRMNGFGRLVNEDNQQVWYASFDAIGLAALRTDLERVITKHTAIPSLHDFIPHCTLGYLQDGDQWAPPDWKQEDMPVFLCTALYLSFGSKHVPLPLVGPVQQIQQLAELTKAQASSARHVIVDLVKGKRGRPAGSTNKNHKWLARFILAPGPDGKPRYHYVYPEEGDTRPAAQVINEDLFGDPKSLKAGAFVSYDTAKPSDRPPPRTDKKAFARWMAAMKRKYPYLARPSGTPITPELLNTNERTVHVPRIPGFISYEVAPGVDYKPSKRVLDFHLKTAEDIEAAKKLVPGAGIQYGNTEVQQHIITTDAPAEDQHGLHATHQEHADTLAALHELVNETLDPLATAEEMADKHRSKVEPFPEWMVEKYGGEDKLLEELRVRPVTTLVTLGRYNPKNTTVQQKLAKEWGGIIYNTAKKVFDAYKVTGRFREKEDQDHAAGTTANVSSYRKEVLADLQQRGLMELFERAPSYHANQKPEDRFDKLAYKTIFGAMAKYARDQARYETGTTEEYQPEGGTYEHLVHEEDVEDEAYRTGRRGAGRQMELSPQEQYELTAYTAPAQATLARVLSDPSFSTTYRRILEARLWLGDAAAERGKLEQRKDKREKTGLLPQQHPTAAQVEQDMAQERGLIEERERIKERWHRQWTGAGGVIEQFKTWTDPRTGKVVDLSKFSQKHQIAKMNEWFNEAVDEVKRKLSTPAPYSVEHTAAGNVKHVVHLKPGQESLTVNLHGGRASIAAMEGRAPVETRILTPEGTLVRRWLELESKLAGQNRRQFTERERHERITVQRPFVRQQVKPPAPSKVNEAAAYFSRTENQELARKFGVNVEAIAGVRQRPNIGLGTHIEHHLANAERLHGKLQELHGLAQKEVASRVADLRERVDNLRSLGHYEIQEGGRVSWKDSGKGLSALHEAAEAFNAARGSKDRVALERAKKKMKEVAAHVGKLYPALVKDYVAALKEGSLPSDDRVEEHRKEIHQSLGDVQTDLALAEFELARRKAATSVAKSFGAVRADALTSAFYDFDFALGQLYAVVR